MRKRSAALIVSLLLMGSLVGGVSASAAIEGNTIFGWVTNGDAIPACGSAFSAEHFIMVDLYDANMQRVGPEFADATGWYSFSSLDPGDYKVRFRVLDGSTNIVGYWWAGTTGGTTHGDGDTYTVHGSKFASVDACISAFTGGTFKGGVSSTQPGFDPKCSFVHAYEAVSGVGVGLLNEPQSSGTYRHHGTLPPGDYRAVAVPDGFGPGCTSPIEVTEQWWKGAYGAGLGTTYTGSVAMSEANLFSTAKVFTITAGGVRKGIHFKLIPIGTCDGKVPTIVGTSRDDVVIGTHVPEVIKTFGGDDEIHGGGGRDTICAGSGKDLVDGGIKNDRIFGEGGNDYLSGGSHNDYIHGGSGIDQIFGNGGNDKIRGGLGGDLIHGDTGNDRLWGEKGNDNLFGDADDDRIWGGPGTDVGWGGLGVNVCDGTTETKNAC